MKHHFDLSIHQLDLIIYNLLRVFQLLLLLLLCLVPTFTLNLGQFSKTHAFSLDTGFHNFGLKVLVNL